MIEQKYSFGGFEIFIEELNAFLMNLMRNSGDIQITEVTLKPEYFDRTRAYIMDRWKTISNEPSDEGIISITYNFQCGQVLLKRGK